MRIASTHMERLIACNDTIAKGIIPGATGCYVDYPIYGNVGDLMIALGTIAFFKKFNINIVYADYVGGPKSMRLPESDQQQIIFLQGGGNFGDLYPRHQQLRERIITKFPENRIIGLPQSVFYQDKEHARKARDTYRTHRDLLLFARDRWSLEYIGNEIDERVKLAPDMAHQLFPWFTEAFRERAGDPEQGNRLDLLRRDQEKTDGNAQHAQPLNPVDWEDIRGVLNFTGLKLLRGAGNMPFFHGQAFSTAYLWLIQRIVVRCADYMNQFDCVHTSRLHGAIMAMLLRKNLIPGDNNYGKIRRYMDTWINEDLAHPVSGETSILTHRASG